MIQYPKIEQFRNVVKEARLRTDYAGKDKQGRPVYLNVADYPTLPFVGTVKLHGTNAAVVKYKDRIEYQSRSRVLSLTSDNAGFMLAMSAKNLKLLFEGIEFKESVAIFGEWCGSGIQKGVAVSELPKMFVIFGVQVDGIWVDIYPQDNEQGIYNIVQFPTYPIDINFNAPELAQNKLLELTLDVEKECPVGAYFGVSGVGEGIVFRCVSEDPKYRGLQFKSKGEKHSVTKVKTLNPVDTEAIESMNEFVEYAVTENRLKQGLDYIQEQGLPIDQKSTGDFLRWVVNDVIKEEGDTIIKNQLDPKKLNGLISKKARTWYFNNF